MSRIIVVALAGLFILAGCADEAACPWCKEAAPPTQPAPEAVAPAPQPPPAPEAPKVEPPKVEPAKVEPPKAEPAKVEPAPAPQAAAGSPDSPILVPQAAKAITVDGDLSDWAGISAVPAPFAKKPASSIKFAWREDGLYGAAMVKDDNVVIEPDRPWKADSVELFVENDFARATQMTANASQHILSPAAGAGGKCEVWGKAAGQIQCVSKTVADGYALEFFIPAKVLEPAKLQAGTKLGMNFAINNDGQPVEQFYVDKDDNRAFRDPSRWGAIMLSK